MLIALYFLASAQVMREIWKERYLPVTLLYMVMLEVSYLMLEAGNIEQRRIDQLFGMFGVEKEPLEWRKLGGLALSLIGVAIFQWK